MAGIKLLILNGPGLGDLSLKEIQKECSALCEKINVQLEFRQTDDEIEMFNFIAKDSEAYDALIINPVEYSRATSFEFEKYQSAIEMIAHLGKPIIEVHITNIFLPGSEKIRPAQVPEAQTGFICGMGIQGYLLAINSVQQRLVK